MKTGKDLQNWRKENHMTQATLAKKLGYSTSRISHIESCNEDLSGKLLRAINDLDKKLNPQTKQDSISLKLQHMKTSAVNFHKELTVVERSMAELLDISIANDDVRESYLKFIGAALKELKHLADLTYIDEEQFKKDLSQPLGILRKETFIYAKKKSSH